MHEMSLAESVREIVEDTARANGGTACCRCGWRSASWRRWNEAMRFAFEVVKRGSLADQASLEIVEDRCHRLVHALRHGGHHHGAWQPCPHCGSYQLQVTGGDRMRVMDIEIE
jgi:hydrogenase nickel incorporation protein HypA/HybF